MAQILLFFLLKSALSREFSVSGISSGACMAVQMHVAYSASVIGAGVVAGGPYYCSQGSLEMQHTACSKEPWLLDLKICEQYTIDQSSLGRIDDCSNLKNSKAWVYAGLKDTIVSNVVGKDLSIYYSKFGVEVTSKFDVPSEHGWVTDNYGNPCDSLNSPYILNCGLNGAEKILKTIYGDNLVSKPQLDQNLQTFDQTLYANSSAHMDSKGYIYVPQKCKSSSCRVHIAYHGCLQGKEYVGNIFAKHSGLNEWAEGSDMIVIYPQSKNFTENKNGCWDIWGFTGSNFALKSGYQMEATYNMAQHLPLTLLENS